MYRTAWLDTVSIATTNRVRFASRVDAYAPTLVIYDFTYLFSRLDMRGLLSTRAIYTNELAAAIKVFWFGYGIVCRVRRLLPTCVTINF